MSLCVLYTSSYARDDNPRQRFINSCARFNNLCARYNNSLSRNNNPFARYNIPCARNNKLSAQFNNSFKRNKNQCARYDKPFARDNNPFSRYNYLSAQLNNLRQLSGVFFWYSNKRAKWPCSAHLSLCLLVYVSVGNWQSPLLTYTYFWQITFVYRQPKQFLPNVLEFWSTIWLIWVIWRPTGVQLDKVKKNVKIRNRYTMLHGIA